MEIFRVLDKNGDGTITREELKAGIEIFKEKFGLINEIGDNIDEIIAMIDMDGNGTIDFKEFLSATINKKQVTEDDMLSKAFKLFDIDGDGNITKKELQRVLGGVFVMTDSEWDDFIKEVDDNDNGMVIT